MKGDAMKTPRDIVQVRIPKDTARRIDKVVAVNPQYAHRQHFVRVAVEEQIKRDARRVSKEAA